MKLTQPIKDITKIEQLKAELKRNGTRDYILFVMGLNTGLRISDIIKLRVADVITQSHIELVEQKTQKRKRFLINDKLRQELREYTQGMKPTDYLFPSQKGGFIRRETAWEILDGAAARIGIDALGCHGMRKTFGYWHYQTHKDIAILQEIFNHSSPSITRRYIGLAQDEIDRTIKDFYL